MPTETEAKFRLPDPDALRQRLEELGAQPAGRVLEVNRIFDTPDARLRNADCGLRIRIGRSLEADSPPGGASSALLTYKGPRAAGEPKIREELETPVADPAALVEILDRLGLHEIIVYEKRRDVWRLGPCEIAVDELPDLGWWLEIEGPTAAAVAHAQAQLGLAATPPVRETYVEMAAARGQPDAPGCRRLAFPDPDGSSRPKPNLA
jgi:adenylate cyclase, class 2